MRAVWNDTLWKGPPPGVQVWSVEEGLAPLTEARKPFRQNYQTMLEAVLGPGLPPVPCTTYDPRFAGSQRQRLALTKLSPRQDRRQPSNFASHPGLRQPGPRGSAHALG